MHLRRPFLWLLFSVPLMAASAALPTANRSFGPPMVMRNLRGGDPRANGQGNRKKKANDSVKDQERKKLIDRYNSMYGLKPPPRQVDLKMLASQRPLHLKEKIYKAQDDKEETEKELQELQRRIDEDKTRRISKRMLPEEMEELELRKKYLTQRLGDIASQLKRYELKKKFNQEQKQRIEQGKRPFLVRDITRKKYSKKFRWSDGKADAKKQRELSDND